MRLIIEDLKDVLENKTSYLRTPPGIEEIITKYIP
jgi:hypothetical protein